MYEPHYDADGHVLVFVDGSPQLERSFAGQRHVFVCGALQHPDEMTAIIGRRPPFAPAFVTGFRRTRRRIDDRLVEFMVPDPDGRPCVLGGVIWLDLTAEEVERIDRVELAGDLRETTAIEVWVGDHRLHATTYLERRVT